MPWALIPMVVAGATQTAGGIAGAISAGEKSSAAKDAAAEIEAMINAQKTSSAQARDEAGNLIGAAGARAEGALTNSATNALAALQSGTDQGAAAINAAQGQLRTDLSGADASGRSDLLAGQATGRGDITGATGAALGLLGPGMQLQNLAGAAQGKTDAFDVLGGRNRSGELFDQGPVNFDDFQESAGFKFRQEQGEQGINRALAARGGRNSGAALKELASFNSGLASQEFDAFANRKLAANQQLQGAATAGDVTSSNLLLNQADREDASGESQFNRLLEMVGLGTGAAGEAAGISANAGTNMANIATSTGQNLAGQGTDIASLMAQLGAQGGQGLANLFESLGQNQSGVQTGLGDALSSLFTETAGAQADNLVGGSAEQSALLELLIGARNQEAQAEGMTSEAIAQSALSHSNQAMQASSQLGGLSGA